MIIHRIHDTGNSKIIRLLQDSFSKITDVKLIPNYHPDYTGSPGNFFTILQQGRYLSGSGAYFVIEDSGIFISSAGWNSYPFEPNTALILSRMYVNPKFRAKYTVGKYILPLAAGESLSNHNRLWITINDYNTKFSKWFEVDGNKKIPPLYQKFKFIGERMIYNTNQKVYEWFETGYIIF